MMKKITLAFTSVALLLFCWTFIASAETIPSLRGVTCYMNLNEQNFVELKSWHINSIRLMVMYPDLMDWGTCQPKANELKKLQQVLSWCKEYNISCILDLHEVSGIRRWSYVNGKLEKELDFFLRRDYQEKFLLTWENLVKKLSSYDSELVGYELLNEPEPSSSVNFTDEVKKHEQQLKDKLPADTTKENFDKVYKFVQDFRYYQAGKPSDWWLLAQRAITIIRKYDQKRWIVFDLPESWSPKSFELLDDSYLPLTDPAKKLAVAFHFYLPLKYFWTSMKNPGDIPEVSYPGSFQDWSPFDQYQSWDKQTLLKCLDGAIKFSKVNPDIPVLVTEFSVRRNANGAATYLDDLISIFEAQGWGWYYHVYNEAGASTDLSGTKEGCYWDLTIDKPDRLETVKKYWNKN